MYLSMVVSIFAGIATSVINTTYLGPEHYGELKFIQNGLLFILNFVSFGMFMTSARILAQEKYYDIRSELIGTLFLICLAICLLYSLIVASLSFPQEAFFSNSLGSTIACITPLLFAIPMKQFLEKVLQGTNGIYQLSALRLLPSLIYIGTVLFLVSFSELSVTIALYIQLSSLSIIVISSVFYLKPKFSNFKSHFRLAKRESYNYGIHRYVGASIYFASTQLGAFSLAYFAKTEDVGYYSLALMICGPIFLLPNVIGTTLYKRFANTERIPMQVAFVAITISIFSVLLFNIFIKYIFILLYPEIYIKSVSLSRIISIGAICHGLADIVTYFLGAQGKGIQLRRSNIMTAASNLFGFSFLVNLYSANGAALTHVFSGVVYLCSVLFFYKQHILSISTE